MIGKIGFIAVLAIACVGAALLFFLRGELYLGGLLLLPPILYAIRKATRRSTADAGIARANLARLSAAGFHGHDVFEGGGALAVDRKRGRVAVADAHSADIFALPRVLELVAVPTSTGRADLVLRFRDAGQHADEIRLPDFPSEEAARAAELVTRLAARNHDETEE